jgi:hypothetical protein
VHERERLVSYLKGTLEILFGRCTLSTEDRESWVEKGDAYAARDSVLAIV